MFKRLTEQLTRVKEQGSFVRNVSITSFWNIFNLMAQLILSPIMTRLYAPEQYGIFAIFNSIVLNVGLISSLRYSDTIIIADQKREVNNAIALSLVMVVIISVVSFLAILVFSDSILAFLGAPWLSLWVYAIPVSIFLSGFIEIILVVNVRRKRFFSNGLAGFLLNVSSRCFTIAFGYFVNPNVRGLIGGDFVGKTVGALSVLSSFKSLKKKIKNFVDVISLKGMMAVAKIHRHFPLYNLPTNILTNLSGHIPIFFFQYQYGTAVVGAYALGGSLLEIVNRLIPYSISSVFFPKAIEMKRTSLEHLTKRSYELFWVMLAGSGFIFCGVAWLGHLVFPWVFGEKWAMAGIFTGILALQYALGFISTAMSEIYKVVGRQQLLLVFTIITVALKLLAVFLPIYLNQDEKFALLEYSLAGAIGSMVQTLGIFIILNHKIWKVAISLLSLLIIVLAIAYLVNF